MKTARSTLFFVLIFFSANAQAITIGSITLTDLGAGVTPNAINNAGQVVGQDALGQAFMWQTGMMTTLPTLGGNGGKANDINDNGVIVGWTYDSTGMQRAFKWNGTITNLDIGGTGASEAVSVNSYGAIVGWRYTSPNYRAMLWNGLGGQAILSYNSKATGINDSGHVVAVSVDSSTGNPSGGAYYWDGTFGSRNTFTNARIGYNVLKINNNNLSLGYSPSMYVVGGGMSPPTASYYGWDVPSNAIWGDIAMLSSQDSSSSALGMNDNGLIVGISGDKAFFYDTNDGSLSNLNTVSQIGDSFAHLTSLIDINNNNQFVGIGIVGGVEHGFVGQIVPEPSTLVLLVLSFISLLAFAWRQRRAAQFSTFQAK